MNEEQRPTTSAPKGAAHAPTMARTSPEDMCPERHQTRGHFGSAPMKCPEEAHPETEGRPGVGRDGAGWGRPGPWVVTADGDRVSCNKASELLHNCD